MKLIKFILIPLLIFAAQTIIFGQETPIGKKFVEDFWKFLNEGKLVAAEGRLDSIKRREPNFDAAILEKALADAKAKKAGAKESADRALRGKISAGNNLTELFRSRVIQADSYNTLEGIKAEIEKYSQKADEVLTINRADIERDLQSSLDSLKKDLTTDAETNAKLVKRTNETTDPKGAESFYYELLLRQSYWDTARRIFPDEVDIKKAYDSITTLINGLGTPEQRAAKANKNMNDKIDAERMVKVAAREAKLESWFKQAFEMASNADGNSFTFLKVNLISTDYTIKRNEITGIVVGRSRGADIAFKTKDGKCMHGVFGIYQEYVGGSFTGGSLSRAYNHLEIRCENINK
jgi:hypothetical protein